MMTKYMVLSVVDVQIIWCLSWSRGKWILRWCGVCQDVYLNGTLQNQFSLKAQRPRPSTSIFQNVVLKISK